MPKPESKNIESIRFGGRVSNCKEITRQVNGAEVKIGIVEGYIATWDLDRGNGWYRDRFTKGAFAESIKRHIDDNNRQVRFKDHHGRTVGGWPIQNVREDDTGLFGIAEINLDVTQGFEAYKLAQQGVLVDFSVGFGAQDYSFEVEDDEEIRTITKAELWEGSIVDEPMNPFAKLTAVKTLKEIEQIDSIKDYEKLLTEQGFSKRSAKAIISGIKKSKPVEDCDDLSESEEKEQQQRDAEKAENLKTLKGIRKNLLLSDIKSNLN